MPDFRIFVYGQDRSRPPIWPWSLVQSVWYQRELLHSLIAADIKGKYQGSFGGVLWVVAHPFIMLAVYTLAIGRFFRFSWEGVDSPAKLAVVLFIGLIAYNFLSECLIRAPDAIVEQRNLVKRTAFPLELFPIVIVCSAAFHAAVASLAWLFLYFCVIGFPPSTALYGLLAFAPLVLVALGCAYLLAAIGVYVRDLGQLLRVAVQILLFLSPVFYSLQSVPKVWQPLMNINPLTIVVEAARAALLFERAPDWAALSVYTALAVLFGTLCLALFQRLRDGFAEQL